MARPRKELPTYRLHKKSGQAIITLTDALGVRRDYLLGPHGSKESWQEYTRIVSEWRASNGTAQVQKHHADLTVVEIIKMYWKHVEETHVKNGEPAETQERIRQAMRHLRLSYGHTLAREFGPLALEVVRERFADHECQHCKGKGTRIRKPQTKAEKDNPVSVTCGRCKGVGRKGYVRRHVNRLVDCVRNCFKWACARELLPVTVWQSLLAVEGLRKGRGKLKVREHRKVKPVAAEVVDKTLPHLPPAVAAMVRLQLLTGMRSEELCLMTAEKIDRTESVWWYSPTKFKGDGQEDAEKRIALGPKAQELLKPIIAECEDDEFLFSPAADREARYARMRAARKSKVQPSQLCRKNPNPIKPAQLSYKPESYAHAIARACKRHNLPHWFPHQLRHNHGTEVRKKFGLEAAQIALGHAQADVTQIYAEKNHELALKIAQEMG